MEMTMRSVDEKQPAAFDVVFPELSPRSIPELEVEQGEDIELQILPEKSAAKTNQDETSSVPAHPVSPKRSAKANWKNARKKVMLSQATVQRFQLSRGKVLVDLKPRSKAKPLSMDWSSS